MEELAELFFRFSTSDRLTLISAIKAEKLRLTQLAKKLSATVQETSRQLIRLGDAKLIEKDSSGFYSLTALGRLLLDLLPPFRLVSQNQEYFLSHDTSSIPSEFVERIGELSEHEYVRSVSGILRHIEQVTREADQFVWLMADQALLTRFSITQAIADRDVKLKLILLEGTMDPKGLRDIRNKLGDRIELGIVDVQIGMAMNEKVAGVCFPDLQGRIDFSYGFRGSSSTFHKWCEDLFTSYWKKSRKRFGQH